MKTIVKYPGSKWRLAEQIVSLFPKHHSYLEPFFGSGAVLFSKPRSNIETVNDLDGDVANLFQFRDNPLLFYGTAVFAIDPFQTLIIDSGFFDRLCHIGVSYFWKSSSAEYLITAGTSYCLDSG